MFHQHGGQGHSSQPPALEPEGSGSDPSHFETGPLAAEANNHLNNTQQTTEQHPREGYGQPSVIQPQSWEQPRLPHLQT